MHLRIFLVSLLATALLFIPASFAARWVADMAYLPSDATGVVEFSHYSHLEVLGRDCTTCHNRIFHIEAGKNPPVTMGEMEQGKSCGTCHDGERTFAVSANCQFCHPTRPVTLAVPDVGDVSFSHEAHTSILGCSNCHPALFRPTTDNPPVSMTEMAEGMSCGACHDGSTAFSVEENCDFCHQM